MASVCSAGAAHAGSGQRSCGQGRCVKAWPACRASRSVRVQIAAPGDGSCGEDEGGEDEEREGGEAERMPPPPPISSVRRKDLG